LNVGFIGLGNMGQGMADNLLQKGTSLTVYTRTKSKIEAMVKKGASSASSVEEITKTCDIVLACLPDVATTIEIFTGRNGIVDNASNGQVLVDHGTVDINTSKKCAVAADKAGVTFLDAPISGGPIGASSGTLAIMVGGDKAGFEKAQPYFERMGTNVKLMGPNGAGTAMKLINQLLVGINTVAAAEAFALANSAGVDIELAANLLGVSWGGSTMVERSAPITHSRQFTNSKAPVRNLDKDLGIIKELASAERLALTLGLKSQELFKKMMDDDKPDHDIAGVIEVVEEMSAKMNQN